jgi:hypothetical protein
MIGRMHLKPWLKILIGLAAALLTGWIHHGPLGQGRALIDGLQMRADAAVAEAGVAGVGVRLSRDPLSRSATLSGTANDLQREGLGSQQGISDYVRNIEGIKTVAWEDQAPGGAAPAGLPLLAETLLLVALAFFAGLAAAALIFNRKPREGFA